jgi:hypothetical protein
MTQMKILEKYISDISRRNRYIMYFSPPNMSELQGNNIQEKIIALGRNFSIPSVSADIHEQYLFDDRRTAAYKLSYDSFTFTFLDTKKLELHKFFLAWLQGKYNKKGGLKYYPDDYKTDAEIEIHDTKLYKLKGMHPKMVGDYILDHNSVDEFATFDVNFSIDKLERV